MEEEVDMDIEDRAEELEEEDIEEEVGLWVGI